MTVIGLTGGIASGKSTVGEQLRLLGATLIDADRVGHRSYEPGSPGFEKVVNAFGHDIVAKDGTIDRRILGGKVFGAPGEIARLNAIVWPEIRRLISDDLRELRRQDRDAIAVVEAAVLLEAGWQDLCDEVWVVTTPPKVAIARIMSRNGLSEEQALQRINAQMSAKDRADAADVKIDNAGDEEQLRQRVDRAWKALLKRLDDARPAGQPAIRPTPRQAAPRPTPQPVRATARPAARPAAAAPAPARPKTGARAAVASKAAAPARPATKAVAKAPAKPAAKAAARPAAKAAPKVASKPVAKASAKPAARPAAKPAARPATKPAAKAAVKPAAKSAARPAAKATAKASAKVASRRR